MSSIYTYIYTREYSVLKYVSGSDEHGDEEGFEEE